MNTNTVNTVNTISTGNLALKPARERMSVPFIVSTTPVQGKEIDLTFVQFAQRKRAATTYIESVAHRKQVEANLKESRKARIGNVVAGLLFATGFSLCFFGIALFGMIM